jgi:hypothetical protein
VPPPRDAFEPGPLDAEGNPTFPDAPRNEDGSIDWERLGGVPEEYRHRNRRRPFERRHPINTRGTVPHPTTGAPVRPE